MRRTPYWKHLFFKLQQNRQILASSQCGSHRKTD